MPRSSAKQMSYAPVRRVRTGASISFTSMTSLDLSQSLLEKEQNVSEEQAGGRLGILLAVGLKIFQDTQQIRIVRPLVLSVVEIHKDQVPVLLNEFGNYVLLPLA